jgi:hypothetical protein
VQPASAPVAPHGFLDRCLPAEERAAALWIAGAAAVLGVARSVLYLPVQQLVSSLVQSPRAEEIGFPLRATAITDLVWALAVGVAVWALLRFTRAPRAIALYLVLSGVAVGAVLLGGRLALNAVMELAGSTYSRSLWSDLQPIMLTLAETVGILAGAWIAHLGSGARSASADEDTLLPALGWTGRPLGMATRLAVAFTVARAVAAGAAMLLSFGPSAYQTALIAQGRPVGSSFIGMSLSAAPIVSNWLVLFAVGYVGVLRFGLPRSAWLVFAAVVAPIAITTARFLPGQIAALGAAGDASVPLTVLAGVQGFAAPLLLPLLGVLLATRRPRVSVGSDTLPAENNDHW